MSYGSTTKRGRAATVWGDGFVDDDVWSCRGVVGWDQVSADEYVRFFPGLSERSRGIQQLLDYLSDCVAARVWRVRHHHGMSPNAPLKSMSLAEALDRGAEAKLDFYAPMSLARRAAARLYPAAGHAGDAFGEQWALALVDLVLCCLRAGQGMPFEPGTTAAFAFASGIHPSNIWPEAITSVERDSTAGWLGIVERGRAALMPADIADYLLDVIEADAGRDRSSRDPLMSDLIDPVGGAARLRRAALDRARGAAVVMRRGAPFKRYVAPPPPPRCFSLAGEQKP